mgnify:CR=1 FL=1
MSTIEERIESVVDSILSDYSQGRDIDKIDLRQHPDTVCSSMRWLTCVTRERAPRRSWLTLRQTS